MATVILASRLPNDLKMEVNGTVVKINGSQSQDGIVFFERGETIGITNDVDKSFWDAWRTKYAKHPIVANGFIFESKSESSAKAQAKELKNEKSGLEQKTPAELEKVAGAKKEEVTPE